jgi:hypothetical protein
MGSPSNLHSKIIQKVEDYLQKFEKIEMRGPGGGKKVKN